MVLQAVQQRLPLLNSLSARVFTHISIPLQPPRFSGKGCQFCVGHSGYISFQLCLRPSLQNGLNSFLPSRTTQRHGFPSILSHTLHSHPKRTKSILGPFPFVLRGVQIIQIWQNTANNIKPIKQPINIGSRFGLSINFPFQRFFCAFQVFRAFLASCDFRTAGYYAGDPQPLTIDKVAPATAAFYYESFASLKPRPAVVVAYAV